MLRSLMVLIVLGLVPAACDASTEGKFGGELYEISCSGCHGSAGEGGIGPALAEAGAPALDLADEQIFGAIRVGPGAMPGNPGLTDAQIDSLVEYIRGLQRPLRDG